MDYYWERVKWRLAWCGKVFWLCLGDGYWLVIEEEVKEEICALETGFDPKWLQHLSSGHRLEYIRLYNWSYSRRHCDNKQVSNSNTHSSYKWGKKKKAVEKVITGYAWPTFLKIKLNFVVYCILYNNFQSSPPLLTYCIAHECKLRPVIEHQHSVYVYLGKGNSNSSREWHPYNCLFLCMYMHQRALHGKLLPKALFVGSPQWWMEWRATIMFLLLKIN